MTTEKFNQVYVETKKKACDLLTNIFLQNENIVEKFKQITHQYGDNSELFEVACTYGYGDNTNGYYRLSLMLNFSHYHKQKYDNIFYLAVSFVPQPDNGYDWDIKEPHKRDMRNFSPVHEFVAYMKKFTIQEYAMRELAVLQKRKYSTPVQLTDRKLSVF